jgi:hypothetical protein
VPKETNRARQSLVLLLALPGLLAAAERWKIQYFYDKADSGLTIQDLKCPSTSHCVGIGSIEDRKGRAKGTLISTSDGGQHWSLADISDEPISLFFLNDSWVGWPRLVECWPPMTADKLGQRWKV